MVKPLWSVLRLSQYHIFTYHGHEISVNAIFVLRV